MNTPIPVTSRRDLLKAGAAFALTAPNIMPSRIFGENAPSKKITLGVIGIGAKGLKGMKNFMLHTDAQVVAVCDVNQNNLERAAAIAQVPAKRQFKDFRELLACDEVDAVLIATPDHWHVLIAKAAVEADKDVYCEKPVSNTVEEGRVLVDAVNRHKAIFQHGTQLRSNPDNRHVCELVRNGYLGDVKQVTIGAPPGLATGEHPPEAAPDYLDWDLFQGPAPERSHTPWLWDRLPEINNLAAWYFISDYSKAGWVAGVGVHDIDLALWGLGITDEGPITIEGKGKFPQSGLFDTVLDYQLDFTWPDKRRISMIDTDHCKKGVRFQGDKDWLHCRSTAESSKPDLLKIKLKDSDVHLYLSKQHEANFIECCKSRKTTIAPIEAAHRSTSLCLVGGICLKLGRKLIWNPISERFTGDEEANSLLSYTMRAPWKL